MKWYTGHIMVLVEFRAEDDDAAERHLNNLGSDIADHFDDMGTIESETHDYNEGLGR